MNIENMTKALRLVESRAAFALQHQPDDHAKCGEFLLEVLKGVEATASLAVKDIEVC